MHKLINNKFLLLVVLTLQEAFVAVTPYIILVSSLVLVKTLIIFFHIDVNPTYFKILKDVIGFLNQASSIVVSISIAHFFAVRLQISQAISITLSVASLFSIIYLQTYNVPSGFSLVSILTPIASTVLLYFYYPKLTLGLPLNDENKHIYRLFNYIFVFMASYFTMLALYIVLAFFMSGVAANFKYLAQFIPDFGLYVFRDFFVQLSWFIGIHGDHAANAIIGKDILFKEIFPNLTYVEFNRLFVVVGGSGIGLALLISMLLFLRKKSYKLITRISIPFVIFNIDSLLIYAVVVLNRFLLLPFVLLPIANIFIAYGFIQILDLSFVKHSIAWMTPIFVDGYIKTGGDLTIWILQAGLLVFDTVVYSYFIKRFQLAKDYENKEFILKKNLDLEDEITSKMHINAFRAQKKIIEAEAELEKIVQNLKKNNLYIYYQPKVSLTSYNCNRFEALIRYSDYGVIKGPIFLTAMENAGLAYIMDIWVAKRVRRDMDEWEDRAFTPQISVNLHPDTIKNSAAMDKIIELLSGKNIVFEIVERSFLNNKVAELNLKKLEENGFGIAIDDFGVGYSSMETLIRYDIDELKLDKSVIDKVKRIKGRVVCQNIVNLCKEMGYTVVAEGVEKLEQVHILQEMGVEYIQGFYFSQALPFREIEPFVKEFKKKYTIKKVLALVKDSKS